MARPFTVEYPTLTGCGDGASSCRENTMFVAPSSAVVSATLTTGSPTFTTFTLGLFSRKASLPARATVLVNEKVPPAFMTNSKLASANPPLPIEPKFRRSWPLLVVNEPCDTATLPRVMPAGSRFVITTKLAVFGPTFDTRISMLLVPPTMTNVIVGGTNSIDILVSNVGPNTASSVVITNRLPAGITLGNVAVSQGSFTTSSGQLLLNFGSIGSGGFALASFEFVMNAGGTFSFTSTVARAGSEAFLENNPKVNVVNVGEPVVNVADTTADEGATNMVFSLQLDAPSPQPVSVGYSTMNGIATAGEDFVATKGVVTFPPFATNAEVRVRIIDDDVMEVRPYDIRVSDIYNDQSEYFTLQLTSATNASIGIGTAIGTIQENDPLPELLVFTTNTVEGNSGTNFAPVVFRITGKAAASVDVEYYTQRGTAFHIERGGNSFFGSALDANTDSDNID